MRPRTQRKLRDHLPFLVIAPILIIVMTYPAILHVFDASRFWVPGAGGDIWLKFWDAWHFKQVLLGASDFYYTHSMFYPDGVSLIYQTYSLPHMILMNALGLFMGASNAYCLTFLLIVFCCALSGYIYCLYLFKDKWLALLGAVIFGLSQQVLGRAPFPDLGFIAILPLTLYFLHRGLDESRIKFLAVAGALLGFTAYCGLYIFICDALTVALFLLFFARSKWRDKTFWRGLALMGALAFIVCAGRVLPILTDPGDLDRAIQSKAEDAKGTDLIGFFVNYRHPVLTPLFNAFAGLEAKPPAPHRRVFIHGEVIRSYSGIAALLLIGFGLLRKSARRRMLPWLPIAAIFMLLRLGTALQINGIEHPDILMPKRALDQLLPAVFASMHNPDHFQIGVLLPLAVLACYGLRALLKPISRQRHAPIVLLLIAIIAFETYFVPYATELDHERFAYARWLAAQEDQESIRLAPLPMFVGEYGVSQFALLHQSIHGYPTVAGSVSRMKSAAGRYIESNPLLAAANNQQSLVCGKTRQNEIIASLDQLAADGFSHVVLHKRIAGAAPFLAAFTLLTPAYDDWYASVYAISQMRQDCETPPPGAESLALYLELVYGDVIPPRAEAVLSFHPFEDLNDEALRYLSWNNDFGQNLNHATLDSAGTFKLQSTNPQIETLADIIDRQAALLLLNAPADAIPRHEAFADWLASHYQLCRRIAETDHIAIDYYLRHELPCELVFAADKMAVLYDNGGSLLNRTFDIDAGVLRLHLWWRLADGPKTSYTIQIFDSAGEKVSQIDTVMNRTMLTHALDLTHLPAAEYQARLIVYDYGTGKSHAGEVVADATRFSRDIEIARFALGA